MRLLSIAIAVLTLGSYSIAMAMPTQLPGLLREPFMLDVTRPDGRHASLDALLTRPDRPGRFPLAVISAGLPRDAAARTREAPENYSGPAIVFAQHGYAAVVVERRGDGRSSGVPFVDFGPCDDRHYPIAGRVWAEDILSAVSSLRREPWADPDRIVLVGHSAGGFADLAAALQAPAGVAGIIDFAGALGSPRPDFVCQPERLVETMHEFGAGARVPSLWLYAANDHFFGPQLARQMFDAYAAGGAPAEFDAAPPFGRDGHALIFAAAPALWWPRVAEFLTHLHLPAQLVVDLPPPAMLPVPAGLDALGQEDFTGYVASRSYEKAFVTNGSGHYGIAFGQRSQQDAVAVALDHCKQHGWTCSVYATGNTLAEGQGGGNPQH
ncbi:MAG TPA: alpha/beta hydrolase [Acetobacteraceae bacterium]|nr:alpha/beta hydrolase [Acetobacteraceae bacterium]